MADAEVQPIALVREILACTDRMSDIWGIPSSRDGQHHSLHTFPNSRLMKLQRCLRRIELAVRTLDASMTMSRFSKVNFAWARSSKSGKPMLGRGNIGRSSGSQPVQALMFLGVVSHLFRSQTSKRSSQDWILTLISMFWMAGRS